MRTGVRIPIGTPNFMKLDINQVNLTLALTILAVIADVMLIVNIIHHW